MASFRVPFHPRSNLVRRLKQTYAAGLAWREVSVALCRVSGVTTMTGDTRKTKHGTHLHLVFVVRS